MYLPCRHGALVIGGRRVDGSPRVATEPAAVVQRVLADAEVWSQG
jgi:hypothetical protein